MDSGIGKISGRGSGYYHSPLGWLEMISEGGAIVGVRFMEESPADDPDEGCSDLAEEWRRQLEQYFARERREFHLPLNPAGTEFQLAAWAALRGIPYGETISYEEQARRMGRASAVRAAGGANHRNPIVLIIPCHRVVGKDHSLVGYGAGKWRKEWLLNHEAATRDKTEAANQA